jgi:hypothetical protein
MVDVGLVVGNAFDGASQQFLWVDNNHVISSGRMFRWVRCGFRIRMFISRFHRVK